MSSYETGADMTDSLTRGRRRRKKKKDKEVVTDMMNTSSKDKETQTDNSEVRMVDFDSQVGTGGGVKQSGYLDTCRWFWWWRPW